MVVLRLNVPHESDEPRLLVENSLRPGTHVFRLVVVDDEGQESEPVTASVQVREGGRPPPVWPIGPVGPPVVPDRPPIGPVGPVIPDRPIPPIPPVGPPIGAPRKRATTKKTAAKKAVAKKSPAKKAARKRRPRREDT